MESAFEGFLTILFKMLSSNVSNFWSISKYATEKSSFFYYLLYGQLLISNFISSLFHLYLHILIAYIKKFMPWNTPIKDWLAKTPIKDSQNNLNFLCCLKIKNQKLIDSWKMPPSVPSYFAGLQNSYRTGPKVLFSWNFQKLTKMQAVDFGKPNSWLHLVK